MPRRLTPFTLIELMIALVIVSAVLALIAPRVGRLPTRVVIGTATTQLRHAFADAGMRARSTGRPVSLLLNRESNSIVLRDGIIGPGDALTDSPAAAVDQEARHAEGHPSKKLQYSLDTAVQWVQDDAGTDAAEPVVFVFLPDGDAGGPTLQFQIRDVTFQLTVSRLTGKLRLIERERRP